MKLSLTLPDDLAESANRISEEQGVQFGELIEAGLRHELKRRQDYAVPLLPVLQDVAPVPGMDLDDTSRLSDITDEQPDRRRRLERYVGWTELEAADFNENLRVLRPLNEEGDT